MKESREAAMVQEVAGRHALPISVGRGDTREPNNVNKPEANHVHTSEADVQPSDAFIPDRTELDRAISKVKEAFTHADSRLKIEVDPDLGRIVVKVMNAESGEIIRQIPAQEILEIAKSLDVAQGLLFTTRT
ncbi:MAG: flagellar protein FlaG [Nitrospiraceae bacterium]